MGYYTQEGKFGSEELKVGKVFAHAVLGFIALIFIFGSFGTVGAGERGVKTRFCH